MAKQLAFSGEAREALRRGVEKTCKAIRVTLGPKGRSVVIDRGWGAPNVTQDGASVAEQIELKDRYENMAAQLVRQAASKTSDDAGDGTTTSVVLTEGLFLGGHKSITAGADPMALQRGMHKAVGSVVSALKEMSVPVKTNEEISNIATIGANNDRQMGSFIAQAMEKVGREGAINVEEGRSLETVVETVEGMHFDRGYLSAHFITDPEAMKVVLEDVYILVYEDKITSAQPLVPLLEKMAKAKKPILIIAETVEGDALATMVVNRLRGVCQCAAVKAPGYGDRRKAMLEDIAIVTGAKAIFKDLGIKLETVKIADLGRAKKVTLTADNTTIAEGAGSTTAIEGRKNQLRREIDETTSDYDREKLQERLAKFAGGVAQIRVGAATETEMKEKKRRAENGLSATRAAVAEGIVPGGGVALLRAAEQISSLGLKGDEAVGAEIVKRALDRPLRQIATNAGFEPGVVASKVRAGKLSFGFDVEKGAYCDLVKAGIVDPLKVTRSALQNAVSVAGLLLTADALVASIPKKKKPKAGHHHPHA